VQVFVVLIYFCYHFAYIISKTLLINVSLLHIQFKLSVSGLISWAVDELIVTARKTNQDKLIKIDDLALKLGYYLFRSHILLLLQQWQHKCSHSYHPSTVQPEQALHFKITAAGDLIRFYIMYLSATAFTVRRHSFARKCKIGLLW